VTTAAEHPAPDDWLLATLEGLLAPEQYAELTAHREGSHWAFAVQRGFVSDEQVLTALASRFRMNIANLATVSPQAVQEVTEALARRYNVIPLAISESTVGIATANPHDLDCERALEFALGRTVRMSLASPRQIAARIDELYNPEYVVEKILGEGFAGIEDIESFAEEQSSDLELALGKATDQPIIRLVNRIVAKAIQHRASDIHLEPEESGIAVRYRIDGVLKEDSVIPRALGMPLVARVKIMAQLDIADRLRPQDGRARVGIGGNRVDLRVSTLPASLGEKVVIRILDSRSTVMSLDGLGLNADETERIQQLQQAREGLVLVTGPTGSGKTTLLYSMIRQIQGRGLNIVTVEDPVEYRLSGIVQVQVNEKTGLTFPAALRSILRQDPDVILVGEIRDKETATIAIQAALTGHLVLATLHTIDAASSVTRLTDIGIEPYKTSAALKGIVAQRLLRRVCPHCAVPDDQPVDGKLREYFPAGSVTRRATGCGECSSTGYRGRLAITEVLVCTPEVERRVGANEPPDRIAEAARDGGMRSLWESGVQHVLKGETTVEELTRVIETPPDRGRRRTTVSSVPPRASSPTPTNRDSSPTPQSAAVRPRSPSATPRSTPLHAIPAVPPLGGAAFDLLDEHAAGGAPAGGRTVLLVEDEEPLRGVLRELLERDGFMVHEAGDGVAALDAIDRAAPNIVVLDLNMPRLDGYAVLAQLRSRPATRTVPVIVLTAKGDEDSEVRVFEYGANEYITKPFRPRALIARLNALLAK
jgi:type II secretory ATPase GspE/PulE/Tfp pilus assembly ATPase PilB-like protein